MKTKILNAWPVLCLLLLTSCFDFEQKAEKLDASDFVPVKINGQYQLSLPSYMSKTDELNDEASLQFMNALRETYIIVIDESKFELEESLEYSDEYDSNLSLLENYKLVQMATFNDTMAENPQLKMESTTINGLKAELVQFMGQLEDYEIDYHIGFIESEENIHFVMLWTLGSRKVRYAETFDTIMRSFKML
jgi:hypothetical protein